MYHTGIYHILYKEQYYKQTILQHFYKLLMWRILTSFKISSLLTITFFTYNNYLKNIKTISVICKNIIK